MHVDPDHLRGDESPNNLSDERLSQLCQSLRKDRFIRVALGFLERCGDAHMKDLTMQSCDSSRRSIVEGREVVNFGSANFLGLDFDPRLLRSLREGAATWGVHQYSSRTFYSIELYERIENRLANWLGVEDTLLFPCVTKLHAGILPSLVGKGDVLAVDRFSHNSIWEATKIAAAHGAEVREFDASRPSSLERICKRSRKANCVVVVDGVYSMTGEIPQLGELDAIARNHGALMYVDDAHGTGVVGPGGRGAAFAEIGSLRDLLYVGSLSKGFSTLGGFITCTSALKLILKIKANSYIFSGPIPPAYLSAIECVMDIVESPEHGELLVELHERVDRLAQGARQMGLTVRGGVGPIVSIIVGDIEKTLAAGQQLFERGFYVQSVTYPAVPLNGGLLRIQVNANHSHEAIEGLLTALEEVSASVGFASLETLV